MTSENTNTPEDADREIEREARETRKFTMEDAIGRLAGPGSMKGGSPISRQQQAEIEIGTWLRSHLTAPADALQVVLSRNLGGSALLLDNLDHPLKALGQYCSYILGSEPLLAEIVREADVEWGRQMGERPRFNSSEAPQRDDDPYTSDSVRSALTLALRQLG